MNDSTPRQSPSSIPQYLRDYIGKTFNRWTVTGYNGIRFRAHTLKCVCACGKERILTPSALKSGQTKGCSSCASTKHGYNKSGKRTKVYKTWESMKRRCLAPTDTQYPRYGARGIKVCAAWKHFPNFLADMGDRPESHTIDRRDNSGHYSCGHCHECIANKWPFNCRWATNTEQSNNRRSNHFVTLEGKRVTLAEAARIKGWPYGVIANRLYLGWTEQRAIEYPYPSRKPNGRRRQ